MSKAVVRDMTFARVGLPVGYRGGLPAPPMERRLVASRVYDI